MNGPAILLALLGRGVFNTDIHQIKVHGTYKSIMYQPKNIQNNGSYAPECFIDDKHIHRKNRK